MRALAALFAILLILPLPGGCDSAVRDEPASSDASTDARPAIEVPWQVTPFPKLIRDEPAEVLGVRAELGRLLFYDPVLSVDRETACASCHSEIWGMGDALPRAVGHGGGLLSGPGRRGGALLRRNSPQLWNLAFRETLFWDGRAHTLEEQALAPLENPDELNRAPREVVKELQTIPEYVTLFKRAFPEDETLSVAQLASALAEFQRGLVSSRALYDGYVEGDRYALTKTHIEGMFRFAALGCPDCHTPPLFESEGFYHRQISGPKDVSDDGRFEVSGQEVDRKAFRVPSLRNIAFSEPYFHDGSVIKVEDAIAHEIAASGHEPKARDVELITRFLVDCLKDETREPDRPDAVPSGLKVPVDGTFIDRF